MSSLPKNFLRGIDKENIIPNPRCLSPRKGKQSAQVESPTLSSPSQSPPPFESPVPHSYKKLPLKLPDTLASDHIASVIKEQMTAAFENFSLQNNNLLQQQNQQHQQQLQKMQSQHHHQQLLIQQLQQNQQQFMQQQQQHQSQHFQPSPMQTETNFINTQPPVSHNTV
ncbi:hypothetical protein GcC1_212013, partial [Golovinomyces cichoracearum]